MYYVCCVLSGAVVSCISRQQQQLLVMLTASLVKTAVSRFPADWQLIKMIDSADL